MVGSPPRPGSPPATPLIRGPRESHVAWTANPVRRPRSPSPPRRTDTAVTDVRSAATRGREPGAAWWCNTSTARRKERPRAAQADCRNRSCGRYERCPPRLHRRSGQDSHQRGTGCPICCRFARRGHSRARQASDATGHLGRCPQMGGHDRPPRAAGQALADIDGRLRQRSWQCQALGWRTVAARKRHHQPGQRRPWRGAVDEVRLVPADQRIPHDHRPAAGRASSAGLGGRRPVTG